MAQEVKRSLPMREIWGLNPELIKSPTRCQRLATAATLKCGSCEKPRRWASLTRYIRKGIKRV